MSLDLEVVDDDGRSARRGDIAIFLAVVGAPGVGKTSLIKVHERKGIPLEGPPGQNKDVEHVCKRVMIGAHSVFVTIWDAIGDLKYEDINDTYLNQVQGVMIVFDVSDRDTFEHAILYWKRLVRRRTNNDGKEPIIVIVANKTDKANHAVERGELERWAKENRCCPRRASAINGEGVCASFDELICMSLLIKVFQSTDTQSMMVAPTTSTISTSNTIDTGHYIAARRKLASIGALDYGTAGSSSIRSGVGAIVADMKKEEESAMRTTRNQLDNKVDISDTLPVAKDSLEYDEEDIISDTSLQEKKNNNEPPSTLPLLYQYCCFCLPSYFCEGHVEEYDDEEPPPDPI